MGGMWNTTETKDGAESSSRRMDRRTVLRGMGAAIVAGPVTMAQSTAAQSVTTIQFTEQSDGVFVTDGTLPVAQELFVFVHGWYGDDSVAGQAESVLGSLSAAGYTPDEAVAIEWPASNWWYFDAEADTEGVGATLASLIESTIDDGTTNVRLTGHSLGGRVVYWTADKLTAGYTIATIGAMGTAANGSTVCSGGVWHDGIGASAQTVRNYHSHNDSTVGSAYGWFGEPALGTEGADCAGPSNYADVDVTDSVGSHSEYPGDEQVGSDLASAIDTS